MSPEVLDSDQPLLEGLPHRPAGCDVCGEVHLVVGTERCPCCGKGQLSPQPVRVAARTPELAVPFTAAEDEVRKQLRSFCRSIWFRTRELDEQVLIERMTRVWVPMWLVDAGVRGSWQAETGFDFEVQSTVESFANGRWETREVTDTEIRWEPRMGEVDLRHDNLVVRALRGQARIEELIGPHSVTEARAFRSDDLSGAALRLPDLRPETAWPDAEAQLKRATAEICRQAASADHVRDFYLRATYPDPNWTWLLLPLYTTWYRDDAGTPWAIYVHGQTGKVAGPRWASSRKGALWASVILLSALGLGAVGVLIALLGVVVLPLLVVAAVLLVLAFVVGLFALWPLLTPWSHNREQARQQLFPVVNS